MTGATVDICKSLHVIAVYELSSILRYVIKTVWGRGGTQY
jgi:hypothetical protein